MTALLEKVPFEPEPRDPAVLAIHELGTNALDELAAAFKLPDMALPRGSRKKRGWEIRDAAVAVLKLYGAEASAEVPAVLEYLKSGDDRIREAAVGVLAHIGAGQPAATTALLDTLADSKCGYAAAKALTRLSELDTNIIPGLIQVARCTNRTAVYWAFVALEGTGASAKPALPALIHGLETGDWDLRVEAAKTSGLIGPDAVSATPALIQNLSYEQPWVRKCVAIALGRIGPPAREAVPALTRALGRDSYNSMEIARSLWSIDPAQLPAVLPVVTEEITKPRSPDGVTYAYLNAISLAGDIGAPASNLVASLQQALTDESPMVRFEVAFALWRINPEHAESSRPVLATLADFETYREPVPAKMHPAFKGLMELRDKRESYNTRLAALGALWQMDPAQRDKLKPRIVELLHDWHLMVGMKRADPQEKALVPALQELLRDQELRDVHAAARDAIRKITGTDGERW